MAICTFYQRGFCKFGANCKNEHPGQRTQASSGSLGGSNNNRFGAFGGGADRYRPGQDSGGYRSGGDNSRNNNNASRFHIEPDTIRLDLTAERPTWPLSCYGPGRDAPRQLIEGPVEVSPEELRWRYYVQRASGNEATAQQEEGALQNQMQQQVDRILNDINGAIKYVQDGVNAPGNRIDIAQGKATVGGSTAPSSSSDPFSKPSANPFGGNQNANPAFGQASAPAFGAAGSGFGKPSALGGGSTLGQTSALGGVGAFGRASLPGAVSAFGAPSVPGAGTASAFGSASMPGAGGASAFGKPSVPGGASPFGASSSGAFAGGSNNTPSAFGSSAAGASPFGQQPSNQAFGKPAFGSSGAANPFSGGSQASPFAQTQQPSQGQTAFGQASAPGPTNSPFSTQQQQQNTASPFGQQQQQSQNQASPFGQASQPRSNPFGSGASSQTAFGQVGFGKAAPSPWGQAQTQQPAAPANPFAQKPQTTVAAPSPFGQQTQSPSPFSQPQQPTTVSPFAKPAVESPFAKQPAASPFAQPNGGVSAAAATPAKPVEEKDRYKEGKPEDYEGEQGRILEEIYARVAQLGKFADEDAIPLVPPKCEWIVPVGTG